MWSSKVHWHLIARTRRNISSTAVGSASHYDVLGITPKATQAEVKAAYYKLSKLHHPDTSTNDNEDTDKFRLITEAYEVLGNYRTRQLYDKGLYGHYRSIERKKKVTPDHPQIKFYQSRFDKERVPTSKMSHNIYNFDEWTKQHYSKVFTEGKKREVMRDRDPREVQGEEGLLFYSAIGMAVIIFGFMSLAVSELDNDVPKEIETITKKPA